MSRIYKPIRITEICFKKNAPHLLPLFTTPIYYPYLLQKTLAHGFGGVHYVLVNRPIITIFLSTLLSCSVVSKQEARTPSPTAEAPTQHTPNRGAKKDKAKWKVNIQTALQKQNVKQAITAYTQLFRDGHNHSIAWAKDIAHIVVRRALSAESPTVRAKAIAVIEKADADIFFEDVVRKLNDSSHQVIAAAAIALYKYPNIADIAYESMHSPSPAARTLAIRGIGRRANKKDPRRRVALQQAVSKDESSHAVVLAGLSAVHLSDGNVVETSVRHHLMSKNNQVAAAAFRALLKARLVNTRDIQQALAHPYLGMQIAAVAAVKNANDVATLLRIAKGGDAPVAVSLEAAIALPKGYSPTRQTVATRLWQQGTKASQIALLRRTPDLLPKDHALRTLGRGLAIPNPTVQLLAASGAWSLGQSQIAKEVCKKHLSNPDPLVQLQAANILVSHNDKSAVLTLQKLTAHKNSDIRRQVIQTSRPTTEYLPILVPLLEDPITNNRLAAAEKILLTNDS